VKVTIAITRTYLYSLPIWILACTARPPGEGEPPGVRPASNGREPSKRPQAQAARVVVAGTVLGTDGHPMKLAHVHDEDDERTVEADAQGRFRIDSAGRGLLRLRFTGVDHADYVMPVLMSAGDVELHVRLGTHRRRSAPADVKLTLVEMPWGVPIRSIEMRSRPDGVFVAVVEKRPGDAAALTYQIENVAIDGLVNGTASTRVSHTRNGSYVSHVELTDGKATIAFDPRKLPPESRAATVVYRRAHPIQSELERIASHLSARERTFDDEVARRRRSGSAAIDPAFPSEEMTRALEPTVRELARATDPGLRGALLVSYFAIPDLLDRTGDQTKTLTRMLLSEVSPESEMWELNPAALRSLVELAGDDAAWIHAETAVSHLASRDRAAMALLELARAAARAGRTRDVSRYHRRIATDYAASYVAAVALQEAPDRRIREGLPIPPFDLPSLGEAERRISNTALRGDVVLLEFWVSSCRNCVEEIANLHALHERYAPRGLAIVSINTFESPEKVRTFRRDRWPMPWRHVVLEDETKSEQVVRTFEAASLPTSILIDRGGRIAATGTAARGPKLDETLARLFSTESR